MSCPSLILQEDFLLKVFSLPQKVVSDFVESCVLSKNKAHHCEVQRNFEAIAKDPKQIFPIINTLKAKNYYNSMCFLQPFILDLGLKNQKGETLKSLIETFFD